MAKLLFVICSLLIALVVVVYGQRVDELYLAKFRVGSYLDQVKHQLNELASTASKQNMDALILACNIVSYDNQIGYSNQQVEKLRDTVQTQLEYLKNHEKELKLKSAMLEKSLTNLNNQIIGVYKNISTQTNKLAPTVNGIMVLTKNGDVMYNGYYHSTSVGQGFVDPLLTDHQVISTPHIIDRSVLPNATVITEIFPHAEWGFFLKTSTGDIYSNGYFTSNSHGVGVNGLTYVYPMRKVDFQPNVSVKKVLCRTGPICIFWGNDGKLYYTGYLNLYSVVGVPAVINRPTALPIIYNNRELTVYDFSLTNEGNNICIIAAEDFRIYCMGTNAHGQLGDETLTSRITWAPISGNLTFTQIRGGSYVYFAVSTDGRVYNWGQDDARSLRVRDVLNPNSKPTVLPGIPSNLFVKKILFVSTYCSAPATATVPDNMVIIDQNDNAYMLGSYNGLTYNAPYQPDSMRGKKFKEGEAFVTNQYITFTDGTMLVSGTNAYGVMRISNGNTVMNLWREAVFNDVF